ncbi:sensor histidine kinase [Ekhidna sp. To15]|uniref:sensor histidine kinase n=1 Tax=Ekhidna sp. To15 TaxID=3395267 RepID=UPI003F5214B8
MNLLPTRRPLALPVINQLLGVIIISLIAWGQSRFVLDGVHLLFITTNYTCWLLLLPWINGWVKSEKSWKMSSLMSTAFQLIFIIVAQWLLSNTFFHLLRFAFLPYPLLPEWNEVSGYLFPSLVGRAIDLALFAGLLAWIHQNSLLNERKMEVVEKESELQRSKLQSLKNQLNPHFLFNTMHNIAALIGQDDETAHKLTVKVSHLLRKIMTINELEEHSLSEEWEFVQDYLTIESERFQDRLVLNIEIDERIKQRVVPTMILQPLVENAFKHGISHAVNSTTLDIKVQSTEEVDSITVVNERFPHASVNASNGIGLRNLQERLLTYYQGKGSLEVDSTDKQYKVIIKIPKA